MLSKKLFNLRGLISRDKPLFNYQCLRTQGTLLAMLAGNLRTEDRRL